MGKIRRGQIDSLPEEFVMTTVKESLLELARQLPDECTWDEVMYRIYVRQKIETGLSDADNGRLIDHSVVFEELERMSK